MRWVISTVTAQAAVVCRTISPEPVGRCRRCRTNEAAPLSDTAAPCMASRCTRSPRYQRWFAWQGRVGVTEKPAPPPRRGWPTGGSHALLTSSLEGLPRRSMKVPRAGGETTQPRRHVDPPSASPPNWGVRKYRGGATLQGVVATTVRARDRRSPTTPRPDKRAAPTPRRRARPGRTRPISSPNAGPRTPHRRRCVHSGPDRHWVPGLPEAPWAERFRYRRPGR